MNVPTTDLDRLLATFDRLPTELQRQVLHGLERLVRGEPGHLSRWYRLAGAFADLSPDVALRVADAVEALRNGDFATFSQQSTAALQEVRQERQCARLLVRTPEWSREPLPPDGAARDETRSRRPGEHTELGTQDRTERVRLRVLDAVADADADALRAAEQVLVALAEPLELPILLETIRPLLQAAGRAADQHDQELMELRRRLARSDRPPPP